MVLVLSKIKTGILLGPVDIFISNLSIIFSISPGTVDKMKKDGELFTHFLKD